MTKSDIIVNAEDGTILSELTSTLAAPAQSFVFGDVLDMQVTGVVPNEGSDSADRPWSIIDMTARDFRVALGTADRSPFTGAFTVNASSSIPYNATQAEMQTALNNDATIASEGGVIVSALSSSGWKVNFNTVGAKTALAGDENSMLPSSSIYTDLLRAGDGSTTEVWMIRVETAPSAYAELTDAIAAPVISVDQIRNGDAGSGVSEVQAFVMQGVGVSGTFALVLDGVATGEIAFDADSISITEAIEKHPIITGDDLVSVTGNAKDFTVSFDSSLGDLSSLTVDSSNLIGLNGKSGEFSLNTNEIIELLNGANTAPAIFEIVLYDTDNSQGKTIHQSTVDVKQDIIPDSPPSVTPIIQYALASHTHDIADITNLQTELDDKATAADVDAIEARDWVQGATDEILAADTPAEVFTKLGGEERVHIQVATVAGGYPVQGQLITDFRLRSQPDAGLKSCTQTLTQQNGASTKWVRTPQDSAMWRGWKQILTLDSGTISEDLTFSGQLEATGQALATDDSLVTREGVGMFYTHGFEDHNSTDAAFSPSSGVRTKVVNNGLGAFTNTSYKIPGRGDIWDAVAGEFNFLDAGLVLGDTVTIRMDFELTTTSTNDGFKVELDLGTGAGLYTLTLSDQYYRFTGTNNFTIISEIYMGDTNTLNNPATIYITPDAGGTTVNYNGHYVKYSLRNLSLT